MTANDPDPEQMPTVESGAGAPMRGVADAPTDADLDAREREKAQPRRAAGPSMGEEGAEAAREAGAHAPPPATDPGAEGEAGTAPSPGAETGGESQQGEAGRAVDHAGAKPSTDELDRRDRKSAAPRRAPGPPLRPEGFAESLRGAEFHEPPPATDPET